MGFVVAPANSNDSVLLPDTLEAVDDQGLLEEVEALHLDRGYDNSVVRQQVADAGIKELVVSSVRRDRTPVRRPRRRVPLGRRWVVERTNSWLSNYGQLRRNTDRKVAHRHAALAFVIAILLIAKLLDADHLARS
jgi:transposase